MVSLYEQEKVRVQQQLNSAECYAITTDVWTSRTKYAYCAVMVHFITDFKLQSFLISEHEFPDSDTAENIVQEIRDTLSVWNLSVTRIVAATTDNRANITAGISLLGVTQLQCFSHTLQSAVEQTLKLSDISKLTARCKCLVAHFNQSTKSYVLLHQKQIALGHEQHAQVNDVVTQWNSCYYMVARVMEQQQPLCTTVQLASKFTARIGKNAYLVRLFARHVGLLAFDARVSRSFAQETMLASYAAGDLYILTRSPT